MHAKVFTAGSASQLERDLNAWLDANPRIRITHAVQSTEPMAGQGASGTTPRLVLTLLYTGPRATAPPPPGVQHRE